MARFKIDENLPAELSQLLMSAGHDAMTVADQQMTGCPDHELAEKCRIEKRTLISLDLGFANIHAYPPSSTPGHIILRLRRLDKTHVLDVAKRLIPSLATFPLHQHLWVVDESTIRIRG